MCPAAQGEYIFLPQEKVIYGAGCLGRLAGEVERLGGRQALVVTGRTLSTSTSVIQKIEDVLGARHAGTYAGIQQHAPERGIVEATRLAEQVQADLLISVGGGSPIDATKTVARALKGKDGSLLPHIAIPTTLSAAEFSHVAGYTDEATKSKTGFADRRATPRVVILDPEITLYTPMWLWLSSGVRSLDHAVETLYSPGYHPISDVLVLESISRLFEHLPGCKDNPMDIEARHQCQLAAWMSYFAPASVGAHLGLSHTIGKRIGARYDVPHGITSCILLAHVMRFKARKEAARLAPIATRLGLVSNGVSDTKAALAAAEAIARLVRQLELPSRLKEVNVPREAFEEIASAAARDGTRKEEILKILQQSW